MTINTTGVEIKRFFASQLPDDQWFEEEIITVDGMEFQEGDDVNQIPDSSVVTLSGGFVANDPKERTVEGLFRAWKKRQNTITLFVEADRGDEVAVRAALKALGVKVWQA